VNHVFELAGGVGNQLFQIEAAQMLVETPIFDVSMLRPPFMNHGSMAYQLENKHLVKVDSRSQLGPLFWSGREKVDTVSDLLFGNLNLTGQIRLSEPGFDLRSNLKITSAKHPLRIRGYFQSFRYLNFAPQGLGCQPFDFTSEASNEFLRLGLDESSWASIHIRLGDFKLLSGSVGVLSPTYYRAAIKRVVEKLGIERFVLFSDSPEEAFDLITESGMSQFVSIASKSLSPSASLGLLSRSSASVIGNSTFSYWGAAKNPSAVEVIAPWPWFRSTPAPNELLPHHWVRLASEFIQ
jgi:hypothetical protein